MDYWNWCEIKLTDAYMNEDFIGWNWLRMQCLDVILILKEQLTPYIVAMEIYHSVLTLMGHKELWWKWSHNNILVKKTQETADLSPETHVLNENGWLISTQSIGI